jgi:hypothetical protein
MPKEKESLSPGEIAKIRHEISELCAIGASDDQIAYALSISPSRLRRSYRKELTKGRSQLKRTLMRTIVEKALAGDVGLLIWLENSTLGPRGTKLRRSSNRF